MRFLALAGLTAASLVGCQSGQGGVGASSGAEGISSSEGVSLPESSPADDLSYTHFSPSIVLGNKVVCYYELPEEEGPLLVTAPEK